MEKSNVAVITGEMTRDRVVRRGLSALIAALCLLTLGTPAQAAYVFNPGATEAVPPWDHQDTASANTLTIVPDPAGLSRSVQKWTVGDTDRLDISSNPRGQILSPPVLGQRRGVLRRGELPLPVAAELRAVG